MELLGFLVYSLNMAIEIVDLPMKNADCPCFFLYVYQSSNVFKCLQWTGLRKILKSDGIFPFGGVRRKFSLKPSGIIGIYWDKTIHSIL